MGSGKLGCAGKNYQFVCPILPAANTYTYNLVQYAIRIAVYVYAVPSHRLHVTVASRKLFAACSKQWQYYCVTPLDAVIDHSNCLALWMVQAGTKNVDAAQHCMCMRAQSTVLSLLLILLCRSGHTLCI